jgi:RHS repeat-associated protein
MSKLFYVSILCLMPLMAQVDGVQRAAEQLRAHPVARRHPTALQQRAALLTATISEIVAGLENNALASPGLDLRTSLSAATQYLESDFASIEAKLIPLNLPAKLAAWRAFTAHVRAELAHTHAELTAISTAGGTERVKRIAALRSRLAVARRPNLGIGSSRVALGSSLAAVPEVRAAADEPTPADLAESKLVTLTPAIRARALALGNDPEALYRWVAMHTEPVPSIGAMQTGQGILDSGRGNDLEQSTLLIALLRAAGIPSRYVYGDVTMPREDVREWFGLKDETPLLELTGSDPDFLLFPSIRPETVTTRRAWVEAYLDLGNGRQWVTLDPARKRRQFQTGIVLDRPVYDRLAYLQSLNPVPPAEPYLQSLRAAFWKQQTGQAFSAVPYTGSLLAPAPMAAGLAYPVTQVHFRASEIPASLLHRLRLTLTDVNGKTIFLNFDTVLAEVVLQSITLSFNPATAADKSIAEAFGGLEYAPAALIEVLPEFRVNDRIVATGRSAISFGTTLDLTVNHTPPATVNPYTNTNHHSFTAGETGAIVLGSHYVSDTVMANRVSALLARLATASMAESTRLLLDLAAVRYLHRVELDERQLSGPLQMVFYPDDEIGNAITFSSLETQSLFDRPFVVTPGRLRIHAWPTCLPYIDQNHPHHNDPVSKTTWQLHGDGISALEHEVWEELILTPSVSTIKILQAALRDGQTLSVITRSNAQSAIAALGLPASIKATLSSRIAAGATLTVPQRIVTIGAWKGTGWIEEFPNWDFNYIIYDSALFAPGGDTGGTSPPPHPPQSDPGAVGAPSPVNNTTCSDPVNVANGNLFEQFTDLARPSPGIGIVFTRTYNSLALADGPLGFGWRHSYQSSLKDEGSSVVLTDPSGTQLTFRLADGSYSGPPAYGLTLGKGPSGFTLRTRQGLLSQYGIDGKLISVTDRNGFAVTLLYDPQGLLARLDGPASRWVAITYSAQRRIQSLEDHTGRRVLYEYDSDGHLSAVTNPAGHRSAYRYYTTAVFQHMLESVTTAEGRMTLFDYYGNGRVARVTLPGGQATSFLYLPFRNETHVINARGHLTSYFYDSAGAVTRIVRPDGRSLDRVYNSLARLESQTDAIGSTTRYEYDAAGDLVTVRDPLGLVLGFTYSPEFHLVTSIRSGEVELRRFEYDAAGNLTRAFGAQGEVTRYDRDGSGRLTAVTNAEGHTTALSYDAEGNLVGLTDPLGRVTNLAYDAAGRLTKSVDVLGLERSVEYDAMDRAVRLVSPSGRATSYAYSPDGLLATATDAAGRISSFGYDERANLSEVVDPLGQKSRASYSALECACASTSNLSAYVNAAGLAVGFEYDQEDRLTSAAGPSAGKELFTYDANSRLTAKIDANGIVTNYGFDARGRITRISAGDDETRLVYAPNGNLLQAANSAVTYTFTYDLERRLASVTDSRFNQTIAYSYDAMGRRKSLSKPDGTTYTYEWFPTGRIASIRSSSGTWVAWEYDPLGRPVKTSYSNGTTLSTQYDPDGRIAARQSNDSAGTSTNSEQFTYDAAGNLAASGGTRGNAAYRYDELDRLVEVSREARSVESFSYDPAGNRTSATGRSFTYDRAGQLTGSGDESFEYDNHGNLIRRTGVSGQTTYTWNARQQLIRIDLPGGGFAAYRYDPFGRRIEKNVNGVTTAYLYDLSSILLELDGAGATRASYGHGPDIDQPLIMERDGEPYFYAQDAASNVAALTGTAGSTVCSYTYDAFGSSEPCAGPANPFTFAAREFDTESGLVFMRARYYDPALGRFLSPDPAGLTHLVLAGKNWPVARNLLPVSASALTGRRSLAALRAPQQLNPYAYALNNPHAFRDPSGLSCSVHVQIGWQSWEGGATDTGPLTFTGNINNFNHWLQMNHYSVSYVDGGFADVTDLDTGHIVGVVDAASAGFTPVPFQPSPSVLSPQYWQQVGTGFQDVGQSLIVNFQSSFNVPWNQLTGQQYWEAANNPQAHVRP